MKKGDNFLIHGYKHNGDLYKVWDETIFLDQTDEYYVFVNNKIIGISLSALYVPSTLLVVILESPISFKFTVIIILLDVSYCVFIALSLHYYHKIIIIISIKRLFIFNFLS